MYQLINPTLGNPPLIDGPMGRIVYPSLIEGPLIDEMPTWEISITNGTYEGRVTEQQFHQLARYLRRLL